MLRKKGIVLMIMGGVLILSALLLFLYNSYESERAGAEAEQTLAEVKLLIEETPEEPSEEPETRSEEISVSDNEVNPEMKTLEIGGYDYIGYITIPDADIELPVMSEWDYSRLKLAPCRYFGSVKTDDLVIAGHNTNGHFSRLKKLELGAKVLFTSMDEEEIVYSVEKIEILYPDEVDKVVNSDYDLVLYTCTYSAKARHTIFCNRAEEDREADTAEKES